MSVEFLTEDKWIAKHLYLVELNEMLLDAEENLEELEKSSYYMDEFDGALDAQETAESDIEYYKEEIADLEHELQYEYERDFLNIENWEDPSPINSDFYERAGQLVLSLE